MDYIYGKLSDVTSINEFIERLEICEDKVAYCVKQVDTMTEEFDAAMIEFGHLSDEVHSYSGLIEALDTRVTSLESNKEDKANKVTEWSNEVSDTKYPSEKLVKDSLDEVESKIPAAQVNSDWNAVSGVAEILNKPNLATVATSGEYNDLLNTPDLSDVVRTSNTPGLLKSDGTVDTNTYLTTVTIPITGIQVNSTTITPVEGVVNIPVPSVNYPVTDVQVDGTSVLDGTVAKITLPTFTQVQADWGQTVTTEPDYIKNKPTIPTVTSDLENDSGFITGIDSSDVTTALGYTPYSEANPNGYITSEGVVYSINGLTPNAQGEVSLTIPTVTIEEIQVNGTTVTPTSGVVDIPVPSVPITSIEVNGVVVTPSSGVIDITIPSASIEEIQVNGVAVTPVQGVVDITVPTPPVTSVNGQTGAVSLTIPDAVSANTGATPSATLTDIQVGSTVYNIPQGAVYSAGTGITINASNTISLDTNFLSTCIGYEEVVE